MSRRRVLPPVVTGVLYGIGLPIILLIAWAVSSNVAPNRFFPGPDRIAEAFVSTWVGESFFVDVLPSLTRLALGIVIAIALGVAAGVLIGSIRNLRSFVEPLLEFFRAIPPPVLIPVLLLVVGINDEMKVVAIVSGAIWPVLLNTIEGVRAVDPVVADTSRSYRLGRLTRLRYVVLPSASPQIMTGVRQTLSVAVIMMVIAEMLGASSSGLGYRISYFQRNYLIAEMWSGIVLLGLVGIALALIFQVVERRVLNWYHGLKEVEHA